VGGLCNRSLTGFATELPALLADLGSLRPTAREPVQQG
jgi:hypothetical protein